MMDSVLDRCQMTLVWKFYGGEYMGKRILELLYEYWCDNNFSMPEEAEAAIHNLQRRFGKKEKNERFIEAEIMNVINACEESAFMDGTLLGITLASGQLFEEMLREKLKMPL